MSRRSGVEGSSQVIYVNLVIRIQRNLLVHKKDRAPIAGWATQGKKKSECIQNIIFLTIYNRFNKSESPFGPKGEDGFRKLRVASSLRGDQRIHN